VLPLARADQPAVIEAPTAEASPRHRHQRQRYAQVCQLAQHGRKCFVFLREYRHALLDADLPHLLAQSYQPGLGGQEPVEAGLLALATLLQAYGNASDRDAVELTVMDKRWQRVLDCLDAEQPPFSPGTLFNVRCASSHITWAKPCWIGL
jgi:hypothetical protein